VRRLLANLILLTSLVSLGADPKHIKDPGTSPNTPGGQIGIEDSPVPRPKINPDDVPTTEESVSQRKKRADDPLTPQPCQGNTLERMADLSINGSVQAAPGGGVYFLSDRDTIAQVYFQKSPGVRPTLVTHSKDPVRSFRLSPDGLSMLFETVNQGKPTGFFLAKMKQVPPLDTPALDGVVTSYAWGPKSNWFTFTKMPPTSMETQVFKFTLKTQETSLLTTLKGSTTITDVSPNGDILALENRRSQTDSDLFTWDLSSHRLNRLFHPAKETIYREGKFSADSKSLLYLSDAVRGTLQVYRIVLNAPEHQISMTSAPWEIDHFEMDLSRHAVALTINEEGYSRWDGFELDDGGEKKKLLLLPTDHSTVITSLSLMRIQNHFDVFYSQGTSTQTAQVRMWSYPKDRNWVNGSIEALPQECFIDPTLIHYPSFDKKEISAFLFRPRNPPSPTPFVVIAYDGPGEQFRPRFHLVVQYLTGRGFGVLVPNIRGSSGYGSEFLTLDDDKKRMEAVSDYVEGARWLLSKRETSPDHIFAFGREYGGTVVLRAIQTNPGLFAAASEVDAIMSVGEYLNRLPANARSEKELEFGLASDHELMKVISPLSHLDEIKTPLMAIQTARGQEEVSWWQALKNRPNYFDGRMMEPAREGRDSRHSLFEQIRNSVTFFERQKKKKGF